MFCVYTLNKCATFDYFHSKFAMVNTLENHVNDKKKIGEIREFMTYTSIISATSAFRSLDQVKTIIG